MASEVDRAYDNKKVEAEYESEKERVSILKLFPEFINQLANKGFEVIADNNGSFQGIFNVYKRCQTRKKITDGIDGLSRLPEGHVSSLPIKANDPSWAVAVSEVTDELMEEYGGDKKAAGLLEGIELSLSGLSNTFSGFNLQRYFASRGEYLAQTAVSGCQLGHKVVPAAEWFDERILSIKPEELLQHLAGEAERKLFMLWLGRIVVGNRNHNLLENKQEGLDTGCRILAILVGEAGNGKSFTLGVLAEVLTKLGFSTSTMPEMNSRFGWDRAATADMSICSDLSADSFKKLVCDSTGTTKVLQIVTGDVIEADIKNAKAVDIAARSALGFATNEVPVEAQISPNEGMVSRTCLIQTVTKIELGQRLGTEPINAKEAWEYILESRGIEPTQEWLRGLMCYLLRCSADYYLEVAGYTYRLGTLEKTNRKASLEKFVEALKEQCAERLECTHKYELPTLAVRALAIACLATDNKIDWGLVKNSPWSWRNVQLAWNVINASIVYDLEDDKYNLPSMTKGIKGRLGVINNAIQGCVADTKEPNAKHMDLMTYFNTDSGIGFPRRVSAYSKLWTTKLGDFDYYLAEVRKDVESGKISKAMLKNSKGWLATFLEGEW